MLIFLFWRKKLNWLEKPVSLLVISWHLFIKDIAHIIFSLRVLATESARDCMPASSNISSPASCSISLFFSTAWEPSLFPNLALKLWLGFLKSEITLAMQRSWIQILPFCSFSTNICNCSCCNVQIHMIYSM